MPDSPKKPDAKATEPPSGEMRDIKPLPFDDGFENWTMDEINLLLQINALNPPGIMNDDLEALENADLEPEFQFTMQ
ncbi:hypothetical protein [Bosea sp. RAC05]|uniref:hypothetical protein n=1 Tax=Bosea sp. RAC05 TaxID=1842539 RepID=UPI0008562CC4|nr:hypothetical protein [Bosea sp. RAC05]AOG03261.1 hypothetical protein BSY19_5226 [Bosea sp. RAC05]